MHRTLAAMRANLVQALVVEDERADPVAHREHPPRRECGHLGGHDRLHRPDATEEHGDPLVDDEKNGSVALLRVDAHVRLAGPCRGLPVDGAHVVSGDVGAQLLEVEPSTAQPRAIASREKTVHGLSRQKREATRLVPNRDEILQRRVDARSVWRRSRGHRSPRQATATTRATSATTRFAVMPLAFAS